MKNKFSNTMMNKSNKLKELKTKDLGLNHSKMKDIISHKI